MKITIAFLIAVFALFNCPYATATPPASGTFAAIDDLRSAVELYESRVELNLVGGALTGSSNPIDTCAEAVKAIDAKAGPALKQAKADPQVLAATKALYIAAQDYFTNVPNGSVQPYVVAQSNHTRLKSKLDDALNGLKLELKLAQP